MGKLVSPNDMYEAARKEMIDGRNVVTKEDAAAVMNFIAYNVDAEVAHSVCKLFLHLYPELECCESFIDELVDYQLAARKAERN